MRKETYPPHISAVEKIGTVKNPLYLHWFCGYFPAADEGASQYLDPLPPSPAAVTGNLERMMQMLNEMPLDVFTKGKDREGVILAYIEAYEDARKLQKQLYPWKDEAEVYADATIVAIHRIYLLGIEDGMT